MRAPATRPLILVSCISLGAALAPLAGANHLPTEMECDGSADTQLLGGTVEHLLGLGPAGGLYCHFPMGCPSPDPCEVEVTLTVRGAGVVEGAITPQVDPDLRCGPLPAECTVSGTVASGALHEIHLNCGFGELTIAVAVSFECAARPA